MVLELFFLYLLPLAPLGSPGTAAGRSLLTATGGGGGAGGRRCQLVPYAGSSVTRLTSSSLCFSISDPNFVSFTSILFSFKIEKFNYYYSVF